MIMRTSKTVGSLSWTKLSLAEARGFIRNYTIVYYPSSETKKRQQSNDMTKIVQNDIRNTLINSLDEDLLYLVQISANTGAGNGVLSSPVAIQRYGENFV